MTTVYTDAASPDPYSVPPSAATSSDRLAGRGARLGAALIDTLIGLVAYSIIGSLAAGNLAKLVDAIHAGHAPQSPALTVASFLVYPLVHGWLLARHGQTVGKRLLGIRIVRADGSPAGLPRLLLLRWLPVAFVVLLPYGSTLSLIDVLFIFRDSRRCLHDQIADTIVVNAADAPAP